MTLHFFWTFLETQKGPNYWYEQSFIVWCLLRQKNGGWNSGQKPATIVTDAFFWYDPIYGFIYQSLSRADHVMPGRRTCSGKIKMFTYSEINSHDAFKKQGRIRSLHYREGGGHKWLI